MPRYDDEYSRVQLALPPLTPVIRNLLIALVVVFLVVHLPGMQTIVGWCQLWSLDSGLFMPWQLVTYAFIHLDPTHLLFNLLGLYLFGGPFEREYGARKLLALLAASMIAAGVVHMPLAMIFRGSATTIVGASGALYGLLMAQAVLTPHRSMNLWGVLPVTYRQAAIGFGLIELIYGVSSATVAHFAHLGGMVGAWLMVLWWRRGGGRGGKGGSHRPPLRRVH